MKQPDEMVEAVEIELGNGHPLVGLPSSEVSLANKDKMLRMSIKGDAMAIAMLLGGALYSLKEEIREMAIAHGESEAMNTMYLVVEPRGRVERLLSTLAFFGMLIGSMYIGWGDEFWGFVTKGLFVMYLCNIVIVKALRNKTRTFRSLEELKAYVNGKKE